MQTQLLVRRRAADPYDYRDESVNIHTRGGIGYIAKQLATVALPPTTEIRYLI